MSELALLDLFSGIGGFSLGLEASGYFKTAAFCEIGQFPRRVLAHRFPGVPIYHDVKNLSARQLVTDGIVRIDAMCGGFPCQDISDANASWGDLAGLDGNRSGLWREYCRLIRELRPRVVFAENVASILGRGLGRVLADLAALGYDAEWHCIPASAVGARHDRDRAWIVAHSLRIGQEGRSAPGNDNEACGPILTRSAFARALGESDADGSRWAHEPSLDRVVDGIPDRMAAIEALGNAVVPLIPEVLGRVFGPWVADRRAA